MNRLDFLRGAAAASLFAAEARIGAEPACVLEGKVSAAGQGKSKGKALWIQPEKDNPQPIWGIRGGIQVGLWPASLEGGGDGGPRGLLRIGYPIIEGGTDRGRALRKIGLVNFIAVEPIVKSKRGFSELEHSSSDGKPGRQFWSSESDGLPTSAVPDSGTISTIDSVQALTWKVHVEKFDNGAKPILHLQIRADRPGELRLKLFSAPDSAPMEFCVVTATMGNYMRLRQLWLKDGVVEAQKVWPDYDGREFTPVVFFGQERFVRMANGDLLVCATTNEKDPHSVPPDPVAPGWAYRGSFPLTQYWRVPAAQRPHENLRVRVNGRKVYWASHNPIPGGLAYENFDIVEPFSDGQELVFGLTRRTPDEVAAGKT